MHELHADGPCDTFYLTKGKDFRNMQSYSWKFLVTVVLIVSTQCVKAEEWKTYTNERFGFRFEYPASLSPGRLPENGAGLNFTDGSFSVTAQAHYLNGRSIDDFYEEMLKAYGKAITYKVKKPTWFVVSAELSDGSVTYCKLHVEGENWAEFEAHYPISASAKYDRIIERMAKGFVPFLPLSGGKNYDRLPVKDATPQARKPTDQSSGFTPQPGTPLRTALMDAIRFEDHYKNRELARRNPENITYKVYFLRVSGDWALAHVLPLKNGKDFAEPRWNVIHYSGSEWDIVDHLSKIQKYYKNDIEFLGAMDMDRTAVARLQKEMPQLPKGIFPK